MHLLEVSDLILKGINIDFTITLTCGKHNMKLTHWTTIEYTSKDRKPKIEFEIVKTFGGFCEFNANECIAYLESLLTPDTIEKLMQEIEK